MRDLKWQNLYCSESATLYANWDSGFFSNCSTALWALTDLAGEGITPNRVCMDKGWSFYRDSENKKDTDLYPHLFSRKEIPEIQLKTLIPRIDHHRRYSILDLKPYLPFVDRWFTPSQEVDLIRTELLQKYRIDPRKMIAVIYRGTDKHKEVETAPVEKYIKLASKLLRKHRDHRILIQTDQSQVRDLFMSNFGSHCFYFPEIPVSESVHPVHQMSEEAMGMHKTKFAKTLLAITYLISRCNIIVNHTGNMALWIILYRGNTTSSYQFDENGECSDPRGRNVTTNPLRMIKRICQDWSESG